MNIVIADERLGYVAVTQAKISATFLKPICLPLIQFNTKHSYQMTKKESLEAGMPIQKLLEYVSLSH